MRIEVPAPACARAIALPFARNGAHSSRNRNKTVQGKTWLALLLLPLPALAAGLGKEQDMSWLGGNWYGVVAFFGIPALLGILCWTGAHYVIGARTRHERERETRHRPF
jgi:hypothetical protein